MPIHHANNKKWFKYLILLIAASAYLPFVKAQSALTIQECYQLARKNYPLIKQRDLITKTKDYTV